MTEQKKTDAIKALENIVLPEYNEIPDVGLYLKQTVKYLAEYLDSIRGITITDSMVSNYVKQKLVTSPVHKEYHRDQIALLIFIAFAKSVLTLDEIRFLIDIMGCSEYDMQEAYLFFCRELKENLTEILTHNTPKRPYPADGETSEGRRLFRNVIITIANKIYIDAYFTAFAERAENNQAEEK